MYDDGLCGGCEGSDDSPDNDGSVGAQGKASPKAWNPVQDETDRPNFERRERTSTGRTGTTMYDRNSGVSMESELSNMTRENTSTEEAGLFNIAKEEQISSLSSNPLRAM
jgi:hypothetical protein